MKYILLYKFDDFAGQMSGQALKNAVSGMNTGIFYIGKESYQKTLLEILSGIQEKPSVGGNADNKQDVSGEGLTDEELPVRMLVFVGFPQDELEETLEAAKRCGITRDDLKAVLTPYNINYSGYSLCRMLVEEHEQMSGR